VRSCPQVLPDDLTAQGQRPLRQGQKAVQLQVVVDLSAHSALLSSPLGQIIADEQQADDPLVGERAVQQERNPAGLVHVVGGKDPLPLQQGTGEKRVTLNVEDVRFRFFCI
jgi:hypothetical protein